MVLPGQQSVAVYDTVRRNIFAPAAGIHRPADHSCRSGTAEYFRNGTVRSDLAMRDLPRDFINAFEEIVVVRIFNQNNIRGC